MATIAKHIERAIRRTTLALLRRSPRRRAKPLTLGEAPRILLVRHDRIGDAIISTPLVAALRERYPAARIEMLLGVRNASVAPLLANVDRTIVLPRGLGGIMRTVRTMRRSRYDLAINLLAKDSASAAMLTALSGARRRIGFAGSGDSVYDAAVQVPTEAGGEHIVLRTLRLLSPLGIAASGTMPPRPVSRLSVVIPDGCHEQATETVHGSGFIAINISGSSPQKFWGRENYVLLASKLCSLGMRPVIVGAPADAAEVAAIAALAGCDFAPPARELGRFVALLALSGLVVTPDTSVVHFAAALGKPVVELIADAETGNIWAPWGVPYRIVAGGEGIASIETTQLLNAITSLAGETTQAHTSSSGT